MEESTTQTYSQTLPPQVPEPVVLSEPSGKQIPLEKTKKRGFLGTLGLLFAGWLLGNLIFFALASAVLIGVVGATGLVKVPLVTGLLFGKTESAGASVDSYALQSANDKMDQVKSLQKDETLPALSLTEDEVNALLVNQVKTSGVSEILNPRVKLLENSFVFTGTLSQTNAPVVIQGKIDVASLTGKIEIDSAKFGKIDLPSFLASNIIEANFLNKIGLSLSGSELPAGSVKVEDGLLTLQNVVNPDAK